jgi:phosphoribosylformylglycinamidine (FGAM) synthase PurS component
MPVEVVQVFVSSTWLDLQPERQAVEAALQRLHETKFVGMEYFGSRDETTRRTSLDEVDRSRVYVGIIAGRYGSGITEDEYRRARELSLPCFVYFKRDSDVRPEWRDSDPEGAAKLLAFRQELQRNHIVSDFTSPGDLATRVTADLHNWLVKEYLTSRLADAAQGRMAREQARELLSAIKDENGLDAGLLAAARQVVIASGAGSVAVGGAVRNSNIVTGSGNVIGNQAGGDVVYGDKTVIHKSPQLVALAVIAAALIVILVTYLYFNRGDGVYRVRATVLDPQGFTVEEAKVRSSVGGELKKVEGGWQIDIPAENKPPDGKLTLIAEQETAFLKGQADLTLDKNFNPAVMIKLARDTSANVLGQVTDARGRAVAGALVFVVGYESEAIRTKEDGNFKLPAHAAVNQLVEVVAEKDGRVGRLHHPAGDTPVPLKLIR